MLRPQRSPVLDALEVVETSAHDLRAWFAVIAGPAAKTSDHPGRERQRAFGVRVLLPCGLALELRRYGFQDWLVGRIESIGVLLAGHAVAGFDELHHRNRSHRGC